MTSLNAVELMDGGTTYAPIFPNHIASSDDQSLCTNLRKSAQTPIFISPSLSDDEGFTEWGFQAPMRHQLVQEEKDLAQSVLLCLTFQCPSQVAKSIIKYRSQT